MNITLVLLAKTAFPDVIEGVNLKKMFRSLRSCIENLCSSTWIMPLTYTITFAIFHVFWGKTSLLPTAEVLLFFMTCCWPSLLELAMQPLFIHLVNFRTFYFLFIFLLF